MAVKNIIEIGHRTLKLKNKRVANFKSQKIKRLIIDLKDTMKSVDLIGIAAPQIGENYQVFITQPRKTKARSLGKNDTLRIYINPKIIYQSKSTSIIYEGCGCLPDKSIFAPVKRSKELMIEAHDMKGEKFRLRCDGILARVIQHEFDHIQGIEFLERVTDNKKIISWNIYLKNVRNSSQQKKAAKITKVEFKQL